MASNDSLKTRRELTVGDKTYVYYSLRAAEEAGLSNVSRLPVSMKVLLENLLRNEDGAKLEDVLPPALYARWQAQKRRYLGRDGGVEQLRYSGLGQSIGPDEHAAGSELQLRGF